MNTTTTSPILDRLSALGDETRTRILALVDRSEFTVTELCSVLQLPQPTVSRQLKTLADEGWVEGRAEGRNRHYRLSSKLDDSARALWRIVRDEVGDARVCRTDAERARAVMNERRLRSARFFDDAAHRWDDMRRELFGRRVELAPLLGLLDPTWSVGDLGVGTGALAEVLSPFVGRVIGVDRSEQMLHTASVRLGRFENVDLRLGELEDLPIDSGSLDLAVLALVLHYVVDPTSVLSEVARVLRPGGRLLLLDMRPHEHGVGYAQEMGHVWPGFEPDRLEAWLAEAGLVNVRVTPLDADAEARGPLLFLASAARQ